MSSNEEKSNDSKDLPPLDGQLDIETEAIRKALEDGTYKFTCICGECKANEPISYTEMYKLLRELDLDPSSNSVTK